MLPGRHRQLTHTAPYPLSQVEIDQIYILTELEHRDKREMLDPG